MTRNNRADPVVRKNRTLKDYQGPLTRPVLKNREVRKNRTSGLAEQTKAKLPCSSQQVPGGDVSPSAEKMEQRATLALITGRLHDLVSQDERADVLMSVIDEMGSAAFSDDALALIAVRLAKIAPKK
jgi:hypothetical protein